MLSHCILMSYINGAHIVVYLQVFLDKGHCGDIVISDMNMCLNMWIKVEKQGC
jgi:hypothetical protein